MCVMAVGGVGVWVWCSGRGVPVFSNVVSYGRKAGDTTSRRPEILTVSWQSLVYRIANVLPGSALAACPDGKM